MTEAELLEKTMQQKEAIAERIATMAEHYRRLEAAYRQVLDLHRGAQLALERKGQSLQYVLEGARVFRVSMFAQYKLLATSIGLPQQAIDAVEALVVSVAKSDLHRADRMLVEAFSRLALAARDHSATHGQWVSSNFQMPH